MLYSGADYDYLVKVVVVGDQAVGKSCMVARFSDDQYVGPTYVSTIGIDFRIRSIPVEITSESGTEERVIKLQIWDSAGHERFRTITSSYYRGCHVAILAFDLSTRETFESLPSWYEELTAMTLETTKILVVGCKSDLQPAVSDNEVLQYVAGLDRGARYVKCSAATAEGVDEVFDIVSKMAVEQFRSGSGSGDRNIARGGGAERSSTNAPKRTPCCTIA